MLLLLLLLLTAGMDGITARWLRKKTRRGERIFFSFTLRCREQVDRRRRVAGCRRRNCPVTSPPAAPSSGLGGSELHPPPSLAASSTSVRISPLSHTKRTKDGIHYQSFNHANGQRPSPVRQGGIFDGVTSQRLGERQTTIY